MASYQHLEEHSNPQFQSPAKVFARLKSKVQREGVRANNGIATRNDPPCNVKGNHGAEFMSPRKTTLMEGDLADSRGSGSREEAKPLTISPIPSPRKTFGGWNLPSSLAEDKPLVSGGGREHSSRQGTFLESTALPQAQFLVNRKQIHEASARIRDVAGFNASNKTPVKSVGNDCMFRKEQTLQISPSSVFSPIKNRLRKRKFEPWDFNNVSSSTKIDNDTRSEPQESRRCAHRRGEGCVVMENLVQRAGFSAVRPHISHSPHGPTLPPMTMEKRCEVYLFPSEIYNFS